ncbi:MAG: peptide ABC transporter substrate-binding protein [Chloroflexi bacterium]|nr:peptide ABC transporter substrate-binding protein [Chloroflexota bacterium]
MPGRFRWRVVVAAVGLLLILVLVGSFAVFGATEVVPAEGGTYTEAVVGYPQYLNPLLSHFNDVDDDVVHLVFEGLTRLAPTGEITPALAGDWQISPDGLTYTFLLRRDAYWHDGVRFTAEDVVFTVETIQSPEYAGSPSVADLWRDVSVRQVDEFTVQFILKAPFAPLLEYATQGIAPAHLLREVPARELPKQRFNAQPVGTGPFKLSAARPREIVLQANPTYYGLRPYLRRLAFRFYSSTEQAFAALQRGDVDGVRSVPSDQRDALGATRFQILSRAEVSKLGLLLFNTRDPLLKDETIRQAIAAAIDRPRLIDSVLGGQGTPAFGPIVPTSWAFNPAVRSGHDSGYRPDVARSLLDQAGWRARDGDGVRERDGQRLELVLLTNDRAERIQAAQELSRQLAAIGIRADVQAAGWTGVIQDFLVPHRFQAVLIEQWSPTADPDVYQFWHSSQIAAGLNFGSWSNRSVDELLEQGRSVRRRDERTRLYGEFQAIFARQVPAIPLYYPNYAYAISRQIKGVQLGLMLRPSDRFATVTDWYTLVRRVPKQF